MIIFQNLVNLANFNLKKKQALEMINQILYHVILPSLRSSKESNVALCLHGKKGRFYMNVKLLSHEGELTF